MRLRDEDNENFINKITQKYQSRFKETSKMKEDSFPADVEELTNEQISQIPGPIRK